jgi:hypothetical protein
MELGKVNLYNTANQFFEVCSKGLQSLSKKVSRVVNSYFSLVAAIGLMTGGVIATITGAGAAVGIPLMLSGVCFFLAFKAAKDNQEYERQKLCAN